MCKLNLWTYTCSCVELMTPFERCDRIGPLGEDCQRMSRFVVHYPVKCSECGRSPQEEAQMDEFERRMAVEDRPALIVRDPILTFLGNAGDEGNLGDEADEEDELIPGSEGPFALEEHVSDPPPPYEPRVRTSGAVSASHEPSVSEANPVLEAAGVESNLSFPEMLGSIPTEDAMALNESQTTLIPDATMPHTHMQESSPSVLIDVEDSDIRGENQRGETVTPWHRDLEAADTREIDGNSNGAGEVLDEDEFADDELSEAETVGTIISSAYSEGF